MADYPILLQYANAAGETLSADDIAFLTAEGVAWVAFPFAVVSADANSVAVDPSSAVEAIESILAGGVGGNLVYRVEISQDWPSTLPAPDYPLKEDIVLPVIRTEFDAGYVQSRRRGIKNRRKWTMTFSALTASQFVALRSFFIAQQGRVFTWTHPTESSSHLVRFSSDTIPAEYKTTRRWAASVTIEEA